MLGCDCCDKLLFAYAGLVVGSPVAVMMYGSFSDYQVVPAKHILPTPLAAKEVVALLTSGLTASIGKALGSVFSYMGRRHAISTSHVHFVGTPYHGACHLCPSCMTAAQDIAVTLPQLALR